MTDVRVVQETTPGRPAPSPDVPPRSRTSSTSRRRREISIALLWAIPAVLLAAIFKFAPLFLGVAKSTQRSQGFTGTSEFVGAENFLRILEDPVARAAFRNAFILLSTLPIWVLLPLALAALIHRRTPGWTFFRSVYFLPYTIAPVVVGMMFRQILAPDGPFNGLLRLFGLDWLAINWLSTPATALPSLIGMALWSFFGLGVLTYLAGLAQIDDEILEAAAVDGAGYWNTLFRIIIPLLRNVVSYWTVLCASGMLIWMFPLIFASTKGGPGTETMLPEYLVYITTFQFLERGYGSALGIALFVLVAAISAFTVRHMYQRAVKG
jgi:raffinose/stachyose/melibiose transport system permease protein